MSPEQAEGRPVTARSDIFSLGAVLYEMLSGRRPFAGNSDLGLITAILRDQPPPLRSLRPDVPPDVQAIVDRCLAKDPDARYADARTLKKDLDAAHAKLTRPAEQTWRRPAVLIPVALVLLAAAAFGTWQTVQARRAPMGAAGGDSGDRAPADDRRHARRGAAGARRRSATRQRTSVACGSPGIRSISRPNPPGARVEIRNYLDTNGTWEPLGETPLTGQFLPFGFFHVRVSKAGYAPAEITMAAANPPSHDADARGGGAAAHGARHAAWQRLRGWRREAGRAARLLDRQVRSHQRRVQAVRRCRRISRREVLEGHRSATASAYADVRRGDARDSATQPDARARRPGSWEVIPKGRRTSRSAASAGSRPRAYAQFAGKRLPTIYHWYRAANPEDLFADILRLSNFDGQGPVKVGERAGLGPWGTLDMAGNVKEWCANGANDESMRYILGGGWNEPNYRYTEADARNPWERAPTFGVRLMKDREERPAGVIDDTTAPIAQVYGDPKSVVPVSDALFEVYRRFYAYDRSPLAAKTEAVDDTPPYWRKETVSFAAAYGGERVPARLFLPKNATPPYQTVVLFPSAYALSAGSSNRLDLERFDFIIRSGRALLYPVYQGTFERRLPIDRPAERAARHAGAVGEGLLSRGRLSRDAAGHRHDAARLLQPEHGRLLRADPGLARAADQGRRVRVGGHALQLSAGDPARQLRAAGQGPGAAHQRPK